MTPREKSRGSKLATDAQMHKKSIVTVLSLCMCTPRVSGAHRIKKRTSDPLEVITRKETAKINPPGALSSLHTAGLSN